jgi:hypothetical protein
MKVPEGKPIGVVIWRAMRHDVLSSLGIAPVVGAFRRTNAASGLESTAEKGESAELAVHELR